MVRINWGPLFPCVLQLGHMKIIRIGQQLHNDDDDVKIAEYHKNFPFFKKIKLGPLLVSN